MSAPDAVDGSYSGIAMYQVAVVNQERQMSLLGTKREFSPMSAPKRLCDIHPGQVFVYLP